VRTIKFIPDGENEAARFIEISNDCWLPVKPVDPEPTHDEMDHFAEQIKSNRRKKNGKVIRLIAFSTADLKLIGAEFKETTQ